MRFGVICVHKDNVCCIVNHGDYSKLKDIFDIVKSNYSDTEIKLVECDQELFNGIKDSAVKLNEEFKKYFSTDKIKVSLEKL